MNNTNINDSIMLTWEEGDPTALLTVRGKDHDLLPDELARLSAAAIKAAIDCSPPVAGLTTVKYNSYQANNDYEMGIEPDHVLDDLEFELSTGTPGAVQIRSDLNKDEALKLIDNLRWLVEQSYK